MRDIQIAIEQSKQQQQDEQEIQRQIALIEENSRMQAAHNN